jgi:hypothetical protein
MCSEVTGGFATNCAHEAPTTLLDATRVRLKIGMCAKTKDHAASWRGSRRSVAPNSATRHLFFFPERFVDWILNDTGLGRLERGPISLHSTRSVFWLYLPGSRSEGSHEFRASTLRNGLSFSPASNTLRHGRPATYACGALPDASPCFPTSVTRRLISCFPPEVDRFA